MTTSARQPSLASHENSRWPAEPKLAKQAKAIRNYKKAVLMVSGAAVQKFMDKMEHEQEIVMNLADMGMAVYAAESALLRAQKLIDLRGEEACQHQIDIVKAYVYDVSKALSVFVGLIITNCIIMGRLEAFAMANNTMKPANFGMVLATPP